MRTAILALVLILAATPFVVSAQELLTVVNGSGIDAMYLAYEDGQVWIANGAYFGEITEANRGIPIRSMHAWSPSVAAMILYDDNQIWVVSPTTGFAFVGDVTRPGDPDLHAIWVAMANNQPLTIAYEDGQIWSLNTNDGTLTRRSQWERPNPLSGVDEVGDYDGFSITPNPSNGLCQVAFSIRSDSHVSVQVLDVSGRILRNLMNSPHPVGDYRLAWDGLDDAGRKVPAGVYLTRIQTVEGVKTGRVVLAR